MSFVLDNTLKVSLLMVAGLAVASLLRRRSAALRHWVLAMTLVCAVVVPLIEPWLPTWGLPSRAFASAGAQSSTGAPLSPDSASAASIEIAPIAAGPARTRRTSLSLLEAAGVLGTIASIVVLMVGLLRLRWLASRAHPITSGTWAEAVREVEREYGLRRTVHVLHSAHPSLLVTWGVLRPRVMVPRAAASWADDRIRVVLRHELAHIQRGDWLVQLAGELARALFWFNPLIWIACARLRDESERACDDAVLRTLDAPEYAAHLIELARVMRAESWPRMPAPGVVEPSRLERRITAMLDMTLVRTPTTRALRFGTAAAVLALTVGIAAAQTGPSVLTGSVVDATGAPVPGVTVTLVNEQSRARFEVATDENGRYEFVPLPAGDYLLRATYPAFDSAQDLITLSGRSVRRDFTLAVGEVHEQVSVRGKNVFRLENADFVSPDGDRVKFKVFEIRPEESNSGGFSMSVRGQIGRAVRGSTKDPATATVPCEPSATGGRVRPPAKIKNVVPVYPEGAVASGEVELSGVITSDGSVKDLRVSKALQRDLDAAALEAVRQWQFESPLLNCRPMDIPFIVKVDFGIQ